MGQERGNRVMPSGLFNLQVWELKLLTTRIDLLQLIIKLKAWIWLLMLGPKNKCFKHSNSKSMTLLEMKVSQILTCKSSSRLSIRTTLSHRLRIINYFHQKGHIWVTWHWVSWTKQMVIWEVTATSFKTLLSCIIFQTKWEELLTAWTWNSVTNSTTKDFTPLLKKFGWRKD